MRLFEITDAFAAELENLEDWIKEYDKVSLKDLTTLDKFVDLIASWLMIRPQDIDHFMNIGFVVNTLLKFAKSKGYEIKIIKARLMQNEALEQFIINENENEPLDLGSLHADFKVDLKNTARKRVTRLSPAQWEDYFEIWEGFKP